MRIGTDIQEVSRIKKAMEVDSFVSRILHPSEEDYVMKFKNSEAHIAGFFSAKESVMKALEDCKRISFKDIKITHNELGAPKVELYGEAKRVFDALNAKEILVSISQTGTYATAMCVIN